MKEKTWIEAITIVLSSAPEPMHISAIAERISELNLKKTLGATPAATVGANLYVAVKSPDSVFEKTAKGYFRIKPNTQSSIQQVEIEPESSTFQFSDIGGDVEEETGALKAFGMYWRRDAVLWTGKPKLYGRQTEGSDKVNFCQQIGVYILLDRDRAIYVGRAADSIYTRLKAHTTDRLAGRWDRFSWFGLKSVNEKGELENHAVKWNFSVVIDTLEAVLIESIEPPLNRRKGDGLAAIEYFQVVDPDIDKIKKSELLEQIKNSMGL